MKILTGPPDALVREYGEVLALDGVELNLTEAALREVRARPCARAWARVDCRAIMEEVMGRVMFEAPEQRGARVTVDAAQVRRALGAWQRSGPRGLIAGHAGQGQVRPNRVHPQADASSPRASAKYWFFELPGRGVVGRADGHVPPHRPDVVVHVAEHEEAGPGGVGLTGGQPEGARGGSRV